MKFINIMGTNGLGKSTRVNALVDFLGDDFIELEYNFNKTTKKIPEGLPTTIKNIGRYYPKYKTFIVGRKNKKDVWVGLDQADITTFDDKYEFYKWIQKEFPELELFVQEGYFNNRSMRSSPNANRELFHESHTIIFIYDNINEFIERCSGRTGIQKTLEWAEKSPGWNDNNTYINLYKRYTEEACELHTVKKYDKDAPKDLLIQELFNTTFIVEEQEIVTDEW